MAGSTIAALIGNLVLPSLAETRMRSALAVAITTAVLSSAHLVNAQLQLPTELTSKLDRMAREGISLPTTAVGAYWGSGIIRSRKENTWHRKTPVRARSAARPVSTHFFVCQQVARFNLKAG